MKVIVLWYGGSSYANPELQDAEEFESLQDAKNILWHREHGGDRYYPCVEDSEMEVWIGRLKDWRYSDMPDYVLTLGPQGGVKTERIRC